jgi:seryl-tRNA synthetase
MSKVINHREIPGYQWIPNGQSNLSGDVFKLFKILDEMFLRLAARAQAKEFYFPPFIQAKELNRLDYFKSFPHLITFPVAMNQDLQGNLDQFVAGEKCDKNGEVHLTEIDKVCDCLTPAACYHFYIQFQEQDLKETQYLTTRAHCFRREQFYLPLQRQWAFNMREVVCIGAGEEVREFIKKYRELASEIFVKLDLNIQWEVATDPFFNPESNPKFVMQSLDPVKHEMILDGHLSIGSTNFHKDYFGESFHIKHQGQTASSGCIAFGLERWIFAIIERYGVDSKNWPLAEIENV